MSRVRKYPRELLDRGARVVIESARPIAHVARDLGVPSETLRKYVRQVEADEGRRPDLRTAAEREEMKALRKEVYELRRANEILKAASVFSRPSSTQTVRGEPLRRAAPRPLRRRADLPDPGRVGVRVLPARYRAALGAGRGDERLLEQIERVHAANFRCYGYRRSWLALKREGVEVGRDRVKRLMRAHGIQGAKRRGKPWRTTIPDRSALRSPDLVKRDFTAEGPDRLWVADFKYLRCWEGLVFFAFVIDVYSRRIVGWQFASHMRTDLVLDALRMALSRRRPGADLELVHHSDAGSLGQIQSVLATLEWEELRWVGRCRLGSVRVGR
jgi:transposase-like protein